jgi:hypothetical protein
VLPCQALDEAGELELRPSDLATKYRELVAENEDLNLLGLLAAQEEHGELQDASQRSVREDMIRSSERLGVMAGPNAPPPQRPSSA